jgi:methionyl aminopeptidase
LHCAPFVFHYPRGFDHVIDVGHVFTIEPIIMMYEPDVMYTWEDNWTVIAQDTPSAQWEHTLAIHDDGPEILTLREGEESPFA